MPETNRPQWNFPSFERNENQNKHRKQNRRNLIHLSLEMKSIVDLNANLFSSLFTTGQSLRFTFTD